MDPDRGEAHIGVLGQRLTWRSWWDGEGRIADDYRIEHIPAFILIDRQGVVRHKVELPDVWRLEGMIENLLTDPEG